LTNAGVTVGIRFFGDAELFGDHFFDEEGMIA
jgi:hypothetical protein